MSGRRGRTGARSRALVALIAVISVTVVRDPKVMVVFLALILGLLYLDPREHIFTIDADTEIVGLTFEGDNPFDWPVGGAVLLEDPWTDDISGEHLPEFASLQIGGGTDVVLQRHGIRALTIILRSGDESGVIWTGNDEGRPLGAWALMRIVPEQTPVVLPFQSQLTVGDDVAQGVDSLLLRGSISILEEQLIRSARYRAGEHGLDRGDRISFWNRAPGAGERPAEVRGFVRLEPSDQEAFTEAANALQVMAHGQAHFARIERFGSLGYEVRAHRWARFLYDPFLAAIAAIGALVIALIELLGRNR